ncbi:DUF6036 family nucleotidyltransferase [Collinsella tanakaei]|uniref:DUF6036 family nucleotidyltransferase n=1 Tax=Collinsella tanakaei TaxID=626935 RepID=UPI0025A34B89|nr:DUF6036 family nucleotidyltransferase [Collinsella tanakaei]MDM8300284.1 DUF6036 family nucleotidyltransferase [Collinsella tanakaei]
MWDLNSTRLKELLTDLDEEAYFALGASEEKMPLVIAGGSAFILHEVTNRPVTHDVDILNADSRLKGIIRNYPELNGDIAAFCDAIPYNYENRLVALDIVTRAIGYYVPSLEDLAVMKLYAWRPNDIADLTNPSFLQQIDWDMLEHLVFNDHEAKASCLSERRYLEMVATYRQYARTWRARR